MARVKFIPQQKNANKHTAYGLRLLEKSIQEDGFIDAQTAAADGEVISGSARLEVSAEKFGNVEPIIVHSDGTRPIIVIRDDIPNASHARAKRLSVAANQIAKVDFDPDWGLLQEWGAEDAGIKALFSEKEWQEGTGEVPEIVDAEPQVDRAAELLEKWQVKTGNLWQIGNHRLLCGDSTKRENVERLMGGERAELLFTSPPYSDMRDYEGGDMSIEKLVEFISAFSDFCNYQVINLGIQRKDNEVFEYWNEYIKAARDNGYKFLSWNVWNREGAGFSMAQITAMFAIQHEFIFVFGRTRKELNLTIPNKSGGEYNDHSSNRQSDGSVKKGKDMVIRSHRQLGTVSTLINEQARDVTKYHPAVMPVTLPQQYIEATTNENDIIAEPFAGSGTTIIAAENLGRRCYAMEISDKYGAVILQRFSDAFPNIEIKKL